MGNQGGLVYQEYSHIVPSLRMVTIEGVAAGVAAPVTGAEEGDILLAAVAVVDAPPSDLLEDATFENGEITLATTDLSGSTLLVLYWDANAVMEHS
jgi:hypothetical protein